MSPRLQRPWGAAGPIRLVFPLLLVLPGLAAPAAAASCLKCHQTKTPGVVRAWRESVHARARVGCEACHGNDHRRIRRGAAYVGAKACGRCHARPYREHLASRHGLGLHSGWGCTRAIPGRHPSECQFCHEEGGKTPKTVVQCARFLKQSSEMGEVGCNRCHLVERSCAACHTNHSTDLRVVRDPGVCAKCHMGPDHPQWEMWRTSKHGTLYATLGSSRAAPTCQACHLPQGGHDVSRGLTMSPGGEVYPAPIFERNRAAMLKVCVRCHGAGFASRELSRGDRVREQSLALVKRAERTIRDLADHGRLDPMPDRRPPHPQRGAVLVLDNQILYEDTSRIERLFFKLKKYDLAKTVKGAYHQNPAYAHWYGNAAMKMTLVEIEAEASRLRAGAPAQAARKTQQAEAELRSLKEKAARGEITGEQLRRQRRLILQRWNR